MNRIAHTETATILTKSARIHIDRKGILCVQIIANAELNEEEVAQTFAVYHDLGCSEQKVLQLMDGSNDFTITKEGRDYASKHGKDYFLASAIVTNNRAVRLLVNFFNRFHKHEVPFRMFKNEKEARIWLENFRS
jgi:hypothetical protein